MRLLCMDCGTEAEWGVLGRCGVCGGILQPDYDNGNIAELRTIAPGRGIDRYRALMPLESTALPYLGEGDTPLIRSIFQCAALISLLSGQIGLYLQFFGPDFSRGTLLRTIEQNNPEILIYILLPSGLTLVVLFRGMS